MLFPTDTQWLGRSALETGTVPMKQIALSLFVIASSGAYVWHQAGKLPDSDLMDTQGANAAEQTALPQVTPLPPDPVQAPAATQPIIPLLDVPRTSALRITVEANKDSPTTIAAAAPQATFADSQPEVA
jgi:hypothetical protein